MPIKEPICESSAAGFQGLRLVGKVNPNRAVFEHIAQTMLPSFRMDQENRKSK